MKKKSKIDIDGMKLMFIALVFILISGFYLVIDGTSNNNHIFVNSEDTLKEDELKRIACRNGMDSILKKEPNSDFVPRELIKILSEADFNEVGSWRIEKSKAVLTGNENCRYVAKDEKGLRGFAVELYREDRFPLLYKIFKFDEVGARREEI